MSLQLAVRFVHLAAVVTWVVRNVGWIALGLIVATGLVNLALRPEQLGAPRFHAKAGLVVLARVNVVAALAIVALGLALRG